MENVENKNSVTLSRKEAEEYCAYKRQKKISEIMSAMRRSESELTYHCSGIKLCERASRLRQASVRMSPSDLEGRGEIFKRSPLKIDCVIGGNGETFAKVKAYEAKCAIRAGARELTLVLTPSLLESCRYQELRKELRRIRRAAGKIPLKARVEKAYPQTTLNRVARICSEVGVKYFSLPYFGGCQHLQSELSKGCLLEVYGVENATQFKEMAGAGIGRIVTTRAWEIYTDWLKEVEEIVLEKQASVPIEPKSAQAVSSKLNVPAVPPRTPASVLLKAKVEEKKEEKVPLSACAVQNSIAAKNAEEMNYQCRLEGGKLKFS